MGKGSRPPLARRAERPEPPASRREEGSRKAPLFLSEPPKQQSPETRAEECLSLLLCDVDFFKGYNDHYGHLAGDECLRQLANTLVAAAARPSDLVARYGGEEFALFLPGTDGAGALTLAWRIQHDLAARRIPHAGSRVSGFLTVSIGVACRTPEQGATGKQLIAAADEARYVAKESGRNTCRLWHGNGA